MTVYERYCELRNSRNLRDADVAAGAKIGKSTFSDWKSGRSIPKHDKLEKIASFLGVSSEYLLHGDDIFKNDENIKDIPLVDFYITEPEKILIETCRKGDMKAAINMILSLKEKGGI